MGIINLLKNLLSIFTERSARKPAASDGFSGTGSSPGRELLDMLDNSQDVIYYFQIQPEPKFIYLSPAIDLWLGEGTAAAAMEDPSVPFNLVHPEDRTEMDDKVSGRVDYSEPLIQRWRDRDGVYHWFEERMTPLYQGGRLIALQGVTRNIDGRMDYQQQLEYQATHDALTGLHNRTYFDSVMELLDQEVADQAGLIVLDVDKLKTVNDRHGHDAGDVLLQRGARFLKRFAAEQTTVARIGGDEFTILVRGADTHRIMAGFMEILSDELARYNAEHAGEELHLSYGCAFTEHSIGNMGELFREADQEMYRHKAERQRTHESRSRCISV
ncbi:sensor domain-containing diguanylate cyclase [Sporosarcina koreensis]|uniref:sensor domain-containing diguanylate cyclase n=1 Tax=Sporosarcina koreensis TaxID=334735 RepID=UPI0006938D46|nr:sensor domain-containing diguanylate cyclase [Sporosarcina koreensis]